MMTTRETFTLEGMNVSVKETVGTLVYTFSPLARMRGSGLPLTPMLLFFLVGYPLGLLVLIGYARAEVADRPEWEDALTGVFAAQLLAWLGAGTGMFHRLAVRWLRSFRIVLKFTPTHLWHGGARVCELGRFRGLRLFVSTSVVQLLADGPLPRTGARPNPNAPALPPEFAPIAPADRPPPQTDTCLSLVIGEDGSTHGLFGGFAEQPLRALAAELYHRLAVFRSNQGLMSTLDPLSVVETTAAEAAELMHTRPAAPSLIGAVIGCVARISQNRRSRFAWLVAALAGLFASGRMILAGGFGPQLLVGHGFLIVISIALLNYRGDPERPKEPPDA